MVSTDYIVFVVMLLALSLGTALACVSLIALMASILLGGFWLTFGSGLTMIVSVLAAGIAGEYFLSATREDER